jgi:hypothetical protein
VTRASRMIFCALVLGMCAAIACGEPGSTEAPITQVHRQRRERRAVLDDSTIRSGGLGHRHLSRDRWDDSGYVLIARDVREWRT